MTEVMPRRNRMPRRGVDRWGWRDGRFVCLGRQARYLPRPAAPRYSWDVRQSAIDALPTLRAEVRRQAAAAARESYAILDGCDALRVCMPAPGSAQRDFLYGLDPREVARLRARWQSPSAADSVDNVAMRLRAGLGLENLSDDAVLRDVWLHHTRVCDAAGAIGRGKFPAMRRYGGTVDVRDYAPGVEADGYDVSVLMGPDDAAVDHIAIVDSQRESDDAYRALGDAATPRLGPAAWSMTVESFETEVMSLVAQLSGDDIMAMSEHDTRERLAELVPKTLDDGAELTAIHALICECATRAGLVN